VNEPEPSHPQGAGSGFCLLGNSTKAALPHSVRKGSAFPVTVIFDLRLTLKKHMELWTESRKVSALRRQAAFKASMRYVAEMKLSTSHFGEFIAAVTIGDS